MGRKRKNTEFPPRNQMKMPPCRVCDAPGSGLHYGVNSCEACKGFFHRSFRHKELYTCDFDNKCTIRFDQKKICTKCRYAKCLACGMSKDAIKTGRYTLAKKARDTLEVRQMDMSLGDGGNFEDNEKVTDQIDVDDSFPKERKVVQKNEGTIDAAFAKSKVLTEIQIPSPIKDGSCCVNNCDTLSVSPYRSSRTCYMPSPDSSQNSSEYSSYSNSPAALDRCPQTFLTSKRSLDLRTSVTVGIADSSESYRSCSPSTNHPRYCDSSFNDSFYHTASPAPPRVHQGFYPLQESPHSMMALSEAVSSQSSSPSSFQHTQSPSFQMFSKHFETDVNLLHYAVEASNLQISPECLSNKRSLWSQIPPLAHRDQVFDINAPILSPPLTEVTNSLHSESPPLLPPSPSVPSPESSPPIELDLSPMTESLSDETWASLQERYRDTDSLTEQIVEAYKSHIHSLPGLNRDDITKQQEEHYEKGQLRAKLFGQLPLLVESEYEKFFQETGIDLDGRRHYVDMKLECLAKTIRGIARFAKAIPGFSLLSFEQMSTLIKYSRHDITLLYTQRLTNRHLPVTYVSSLGWICPYDFAHEISENYVTPSIKFLMKMWDLELTMEEMAIITAICIMAPDREVPTNSHLVRWIHSNLTDTLIKVLSRRLKNPLPMFASIVNVMTEFRSKEVTHRNFLMKNFSFSRYAKDSCQDKPMLRQMMSEMFLLNDHR